MMWGDLMKLSQLAMRAAGLLTGRRDDQVQIERPPHSNNYSDGPMGFIGQQLVKRMAQKGWPCKILAHWRTPERQAELLAKGVSKAGPWRSPHQYGLAVDIIHASLGWRVPERFWIDLAACVQVCSKQYGVALEHGHTWKFRDSAHVELKDFRRYRDVWGKRRPTQYELDQCFKEQMPAVWAAFVRSDAAFKRRDPGGLP